jgi:diguanylate cyclase (GGDEF)-like protein
MTTGDQAHLSVAQRTQRIRRTLVWTLVVVSAMAAMYAGIGRGLTAGILAGSALGLLPCFALLRQRKPDWAADWFLLVLTLMVGGLAFAAHGLRDVSLLAFPALLVFAGMLRTARTLAWLAAVQGLLVLFIAVAYQADAARQPASATVLAVSLLAILGMTAYAVWNLVRDLRTTLQQALEGQAQAQSSMLALETNRRQDALTGLSNRHAAQEALTPACTPPRALHAAVALLNVDGFRAINDAFGPQVGDQLLVALTERWRRMLGPKESLYRLSGDEFLVMASPAIADDALVAWGQRFVAVTAEPMDLVGIEVRCTVSAGVTPTHGANSYAELLSQLDAAMRHAKDRGRNGVARYEPRLQEDQAHQLNLLTAMRSSLKQGEGFSLHYQPKVDLATGRVLGAEALMRWSHPAHGPVSPAQFIPLAERSGLIVELGRWALREACRQAQAWRSAGWSDFTIAVNVSMVQCRRDDLAHDVLTSLADSGLPGQALVLELTESVLADSADALHAALRRLRALGVTLSIDDFGTGYSNLGYLSRLEVQQLKIDQSFVRRFLSSPPDRAIVETIIAMARKLGLNTVAEGVEEPAWAETLQALGCHTGQGYFWSKPLPAEAFWSRFNPLPALPAS